MRYAAITRLDRTSPLQLVGVGESANDAIANALNWFDSAYSEVSGHRWEQIRRLQERTQVYSEEELRLGTGIDLDAWLTHLARTGQRPVDGRPVEPPRGIRKLAMMVLAGDLTVPVVLAYDLGVILVPAWLRSDGDPAAFATAALSGLLWLVVGLVVFRTIVNALFGAGLTWRQTLIYSFALSTVITLHKLALVEIGLPFSSNPTSGN